MLFRSSRLLRARQVNEDGSIEPMAYVTERINNKAQATLTNEKLVEGYIGYYRDWETDRKSVV